MGESKNPSGKPKGAKTLAEFVRQRTDDGRKVVEFMMAIMEGRDPSADIELPPKSGEFEWLRVIEMKDRIAAAKWLADRAFGSTPQAIELTGKDGEPLQITDARERIAERLLAIAKSGAAQGLPSKSE